MNGSEMARKMCSEKLRKVPKTRMVPKMYIERGSGSELSGITSQNPGKFVRPVGIFLGRDIDIDLSVTNFCQF